MDIDKAIQKMEEDLAALKRARDLMSRIDGQNSETDASPAEGSAEVSSWYDELPALLGAQSMTAKEVEKSLKGRYPDLAYSTIFSWLKRAVERGDYKKVRGKKFRPSAGSEANG